MQYDSYRDKVKKVAAFLGKMYAHRTLIIVCLAVLTLVVSAMVATKGLMLTQSDCPETVTYGEKLGFRAGFLFSRTRYEYQEEGSSRWTTETPVTPGVYTVRASGKTSFGSRNYTDTYTFTIQPREITVSVSDSSITYGETPRVTADLAKGDSINCEILYARYAPTTQVWVNPDNLTITDKNGNDRTACYLISATPRSTIRITPRPLTVTVQDASKVYDDLYLTFDGYEISKGSLFGEDQLVALFYDSIRDVGSIPNTPTLHVYSSEGEDMTELYNITIQSGTLSVEQRPLIVKTGSKSFVYSGQSMSYEEYSVDSSTSLVKGHRLQARIFASILDCGTVANAVTFDIYGDGGRNVTDNYSVFVEAGTLTMTPRPVVLTTESATFVYDGTDQTHPYATVENGVGDECRVVQSSSICDVGSVENRMTVEFYRGSKNVTENYTITGYNFGTLTVTKRPISVLMENAEKPYDGTPLTSSDFIILLMANRYSLVEGHTLTLKGEGSVVFGTAKNPGSSVRIQDQFGLDVTANYSVNVTGGTLTVYPRPITVTTASDEKIYDATPLKNETWKITSGSLLQNHELNVTFYETAYIDVGSYYNSLYGNKTFVKDTATGEDVTRYYDITYDIGMLTVLHRPITLATPSEEMVYDGQSHIGSTDIDLIEGSLVAGHTLSTPNLDSMLMVVEDVTVVKNAGTTPNRVNVRVQDKNGRDITYNYAITYEYGTLTVHKRPITVQIDSLTVVYDGQPHAATNLRLDSTTPYSLVRGHTLRVKEEHVRSFTNVGVYDNDITVSVYESSSSTYVTDNYEITCLPGTVTVESRPLTIQINGEKIYDGTPLDNWRVDVVGSTALVVGHTVTASPMEVPTDACTIQSVLDTASITIHDELGRNVIQNYSVTWKRGTLTVHPRPISLRTATAEKIYDGLPLTDHTVTLTPDSLPMVEGDTATLVVYGSATEVGRYPNSANRNTFLVYRNGLDVTSNYTLERVDEGTLTVRYDTVITVSTGSASKDYDGMPLFCDEYTVEITDGTLPAGCTVYVDVTGSIIRPGSVENTATVMVLDENGNDVSSFMTVTKRFGVLTVYEKEEDKQVFGRFMAETDGILYLRMASYGDYNGRGFNVAIPYEGTIAGYSLNYLPSVGLNNLGIYGQQTVYFEDMRLFMLPYYMAIGNPSPLVSSDTIYTASVGTNYTANFYNVRNTFDMLKAFHSVPNGIKPYLLGTYSSAEQQYRSFVYSQYCTIDRATLNFMNKIIAEEGFDASAATVIEDVATYVSHAAAYTLYYDPALDESSNMVIAFLRDYKEGKCVHYAAAATMLYRALGIPARYVEGFMVEAKAGEWVEITNPGHAWVEVYIDYLGWVQVEVTGSDGSVSPSPPIDEDKPTLALIPAFRSKVYDGSYLYSADELVLTPELETLLNKGYTYTVRTAGGIWEIGDGESHVTEFFLYDPYGNDVTDRYTLVKKTGLLRITPPAVEVLLYPLVKTIDGRDAVWSEDDYTVLHLPDGVTLSLTVTIPASALFYVTLAELNLSMDEYVTYRLTRNGRDVTDQYPLVFTLPEGVADSPVLVVRPRSLEVTAASETRIYDGQPLSNSSVYISKGTLIAGHRLVATAEGICTEVGSKSNMVGSVIIEDQNGRDVTALYEIICVEGTLTLLEPTED